MVLFALVQFHINVSQGIIHTKRLELTKPWGEKVYRRLTAINSSQFLLRWNYCQYLVLRSFNGLAAMEISTLIIDNYPIFAILQRISLGDF